MKQITILYNALFDQEQKKLATQLSSTLKKNNYETKLVSIRSDSDTDRLMKSIHPETCQLILTVNMAGYNLLNTDGSPALNHLTINIVNYINLSPEIFDILFDMRMNFTMSFLFSSQKDTDYVTKNHPRLRNVFYAPGIHDFLPVYLSELDWRY